MKISLGNLRFCFINILLCNVEISTSTDLSNKAFIYFLTILLAKPAPPSSLQPQPSTLKDSTTVHYNVLFESYYIYQRLWYFWRQKWGCSLFLVHKSDFQELRLKLSLIFYIQFSIVCFCEFNL